MLVRPGPAFFFTGPDGALTGFDVDLARRFAAEKNLTLRFAQADTAAQVIAAIAKEEAHIGVGGLYRPLALGSAAAEGSARRSEHARGRHRRSGSAMDDPCGHRRAGAHLQQRWLQAGELERSRRRDRRLRPRRGFRVRDPHGAHRASGDQVGSARAAVGRRAHLAGLGRHRRLRDRRLARRVARAQHLSRFRCRVRRRRQARHRLGRRAALRGAAAASSTPSFCACGATERSPSSRNGTCPIRGRSSASTPRCCSNASARCCRSTARCSTTGRRRAESSGASSRPSPTRSRNGIPRRPAPPAFAGLMQITEDTARHLGLSNLMDPAQSVVAAARYVRDLKAKLPARIQEPDRTWLALAAFNIGLGHLEDARMLAQKQKLNPDSWSDVKKVLPLLGAPRVLPGGEARLRPRRNAGGVRRSRARLLRRAAGARRAAPVAARRAGGSAGAAPSAFRDKQIGGRDERMD